VVENDDLAVDDGALVVQFTGWGRAALERDQIRFLPTAPFTAALGAW